MRLIRAVVFMLLGLLLIFVAIANAETDSLALTLVSALNGLLLIWLAGMLSLEWWDDWHVSPLISCGPPRRVRSAFLPARAEPVLPASSSVSPQGDGS